MRDIKFNTFGEKIRGFSHVKSKVRCQDRYKVRELDNALIIAVADGHGSNKCKYSHEGAQGAVDIFCDIFSHICKAYANDLEGLRQMLSRNREETLPKKIAKEWKDKMEVIHGKRHKDERFEYELYGTTLLGLLITEKFYFALQLGDGDIICVAEDSTTDYVLRGEKILGTETFSLSSKEAWKYIQSEIHFVDNKEEFPRLFMVSTDGYSNSFASNEDFITGGKEYLQLIQEHGYEVVKKNLKCWLKEISQEGCGDDIAVVLVSRE